MRLSNFNNHFTFPTQIRHDHWHRVKLPVQGREQSDSGKIDNMLDFLAFQVKQEEWCWTNIRNEHVRPETIFYFKDPDVAMRFKLIYAG